MHACLFLHDWNIVNFYFSALIGDHLKAISVDNYFPYTGVFVEKESTSLLQHSVCMCGVKSCRCVSLRAAVQEERGKAEQGPSLRHFC